MSPKKAPDGADGLAPPSAGHDDSAPESVAAIVADVLYLDLVAYSKQAADEQSNLLTKLQNIVQAEFSCEHSPKCEKIVLQIGDGIAVVFFNMPEAPVLLALRLAAALKSSNMAARIGVYSGPVIRMMDLTGRPNVAGPGINMAQRVMAFGDAGHILVAGKVADDLRGIRSQWQDYLTDLGSHEVKHGNKIQIFNLRNRSAGNPAIPARLARPRIPGTGRIAGRKKTTRAVLAALVAAAAGLVYFVMTKQPAAPEFSNFTKLTDVFGQAVYPSISQDGKELIYASKLSGNWDIYSQKFLDDGTLDSAVLLTDGSPADDTQPAYSKDGSHIAFRSERDGGGIFIMNCTGGAPQRVAKDGYNPSWSPDGNNIVLGSESILRPEDRIISKSALWVIRRSKDGSGWTKDPKPIYAGDAVQPSWSPNGFRIAFWYVHHGHRDIMTIPASGGKAVEVTDEGGIDWNPVWSPDGKYLYFSSDRSGHMNLWRVAIDERSGKVRGKPEAVTRSASDFSHVSFLAPDKMVFVQRQFKSNLQRIKFDPIAEKTVDTIKPITKGSIRASRLDLSPDNKWLTFTSARGNREEIFVIGSDGKTTPWRLADGSRTDRNPRWSPDGNRIAFFSRRDPRRDDGREERGWNIWIANREGKAPPRQLTEEGGVIYPVWHPKGKQLAYTISLKQPVIADVGASGDLKPVDWLPPVTDKGQSFTVWSWSPDGLWLAGYQQLDDAFSGITIYSIAKKSFIKLTEFGSDPVWLQDNRRLLFYHEGRLFIVDIDCPDKRHEILNVLPFDIARRGFAITTDNQYIYFSQEEAEADVWLATAAPRKRASQKKVAEELYRTPRFAESYKAPKGHGGT